MNIKSFCRYIYIFLSKPFDTLNNELLFRKLECYGIRGIGLKTIYIGLKTIYLTESNRPMLFLIIIDLVLNILLYNNDIVQSSKLWKSILFADDTNFFFHQGQLKNYRLLLTRNLINLRTGFV